MTDNAYADNDRDEARSTGYSRTSRLAEALDDLDGPSWTEVQEW